MSLRRSPLALLVLSSALLAGGCRDDGRVSNGSTLAHRVRFENLPQSIENRKIWARAWEQVELQSDQSFAQPLRFRFVPSRETWRRPGGSIEPATNTDADITAAGYEVVAQIEVGQAKQIVIDLCGKTVHWSSTGQTLDGWPSLTARDGRLTVRLVLDRSSFFVTSADGKVARAEPDGQIGAHPQITITAFEGAAKLTRLDVFGLRSPTPTTQEAALAAVAAPDNRVFYQSTSYTVFRSRVEDRVYGPPAASVPDRDTIVSPTRVIEGFELNLDRWRPHGQGRVVDHQTIWHPHAGIARFPMLRTKWPTVDAAYRVALDVLHRCSTDEFISDPNDLGKWQSGFFMGKTFGFGIWMRDSTHIALRAGNAIDRDVARRTLLHITQAGIDNGCDGVLMPIVGLWDHWLITGDESAIRESWPKLKELIAKIDGQFDPQRGLVKAAHSTSNDAFSEPESGGFALGTEAYFMLAYQAMAELGPLMNEDAGHIHAWRARAELLRANIRKLYWNDAAGFFTTGPRGSDGFADGDWESAGQELAIWPRFDIATPQQRRRVLERLPQVAMNEFGVDVFPYRPETDHFRGAGWVVWTVGMAAAANREGRLDLLEHLIGQQVRNAVMNKTFYEVIDCESGRAWRWPGQVWQAAGFLGYFYNGVLGMEFTPAGISFHPAVPQPLAGMQLTNFPYRAATLDITVDGWGTRGELFLDGKRVTQIPPDLTGRHVVELRVTPQAQDRARKLLPLETGRLPVGGRGG